jgi:hypothetical protein
MAKSKKPTETAAPAFVVEWWPIDKPQPYERNARIISQRAVESVAGSLKSFGWQQPILVDESGVIIAGHTRLRAAQHLGMTTVPVKVATGLSPEKVRALRLADNRVAQETSWDNDILKEEMAELKELLGDDLSSMTGFESAELDSVLGTLADGGGSLDPEPVSGKGAKGGGEDDTDGEGEEGAGSCVCPRCKHRFDPAPSRKRAPVKAAVRGRDDSNDDDEEDDE